MALWPFCVPPPLLCFVSHITQNQQLIQSFCLFVFPSEELYASEWQDGTHCYVSLRDCFDWQLSMADFLTDVIPLTLSLLWLLKVLFCRFQASFFYPPEGVFFVCSNPFCLCCWAGWLNVIECIGQHTSHLSDESSSRILSHCIIDEPDESHEGTFAVFN